MPATASLVSILNHAFLTPSGTEDHRYIYCFLTSVIMLTMWYGSYAQERKNRQLWGAVRRQAAESEAREKLLQLMFSIVVRVRGNNISITQNFVSLFGPDVLTLTDLLTTR